ncbi:hypothetical protein ACTXT7_006877 [Hymenolepis weldensis]
MDVLYAGYKIRHQRRFVLDTIFDLSHGRGLVELLMSANPKLPCAYTLKRLENQWPKIREDFVRLIRAEVTCPTNRRRKRAPDFALNGYIKILQKVVEIVFYDTWIFSLHAKQSNSQLCDEVANLVKSTEKIVQANPKLPDNEFFNSDQFTRIIDYDCIPSYWVFVYLMEAYDFNYDKLANDLKDPETDGLNYIIHFAIRLLVAEPTFDPNDSNELTFHPHPDYISCYGSETRQLFLLLADKLEESHMEDETRSYAVARIIETLRAAADKSAIYGVRKVSEATLRTFGKAEYDTVNG